MREAALERSGGNFSLTQSLVTLASAAVDPTYSMQERMGAIIREVSYHSLPRKFGSSKIARKGKYELHKKLALFLKENYKAVAK